MLDQAPGSLPRGFSSGVGGPSALSRPGPPGLFLAHSLFSGRCSSLQKAGSAFPSTTAALPTWWSGLMAEWLSGPSETQGSCLLTRSPVPEGHFEAPPSSSARCRPGVRAAKTAGSLMSPPQAAQRGRPPLGGRKAKGSTTQSS